LKGSRGFAFEYTLGSTRSCMHPIPESVYEIPISTIKGRLRYMVDGCLTGQINPRP